MVKTKKQQKNEILMLMYTNNVKAGRKCTKHQGALEEKGISFITNRADEKFRKIF